jgi:hypothetical protein
MPIEGPLRELGIHDVFQLLDLSRKTGMLRVSSELRDDEGVVYFDRGRVVHAGIRSKPPAVDAAGLSEREIARKVRQQIEATVFELMSWREGFFSFEERVLADIPPGARVDVTTESLLMEGARRIDEWSRIADKVPNLSVIPMLAPISADHETRLDLLPHEWEVLTMIDGMRDLRAISAALGRGEFEVAKVAYGLVTTGVVEIHRPARASQPVADVPSPEHIAATALLEQGYTAVRAGNLTAARAALEHFLMAAPTHADAGKARSALDAVRRLISLTETNGGGHG